MLPTEVFISHSSADQPFVASLVEVLRRYGVAVWYAPAEIIGAQEWHDEIGAALRRCDWFLIILSSNAVNSMWVKRELMFALNEARYKGRIVPLLFQPCDYGILSWTLSAYQFVDFTQNFEDGCRSLLRVWELEYEM